MPDIWVQAAILTKLVLYLGVLTATGLVMVRLAFVGAIDSIDGRLRASIVGLAFIGMLASILAFALRGAALTGDASGVTDIQILRILWQTPVGTVLALRVAGFALILIGIVSGASGKWIALFGGTLSIWSFAEIGHVSDAATWMKVLLVIHLAGVAFWIGVLSPLRRLASEPTQLSNAADLGHRFGFIAAFVVPVLVLAGGYHAWILVGSFSSLTSTGYGLFLLAKVGVVALLLSLAAANKLRFIPALRAGDANAARHLTRSISVEWMAVIAILLATSILTSALSVPT